MIKCKQIRALLRADDRGESGLVSGMWMLLFFAITVAIFLAVVAATSKRVALDTFADELAIQVGESGRCSGPQIAEKYDALVQTLGIAPEVEIWADDYYSAPARTVQYGDPIQIRLTLPVGDIGFGDFKLPLGAFSSARVTQSEQYWK